MTKRWLVSAVSIALLGGATYFYLQSAAQPELLPTLIVEKGTIEKQAVAVGKIVPAHSVSIKSQIDGIVGEIYAKVGEKVKQGQPLIKVRPNPTPQALTDASAELMRSEADLESAKQKLSNLESLVKQDIIPSNYDEYVSARSAVKSAQADVLQKRQNLELIRSGEASIGDARLTSTIYAPIDGTVLNQKVEVGEPIISTQSSQAATEMMSLADMNSLIFKGSVSEHDAAQLSLGMPVMLTVAPYPDVAISGVLTKVAIQSENLNSPEGNASAKSFDNGFEVEVGELKIPQDVLLRSGFSSTAQIILKKSENVLTLPERALQFDGDAPNVLIPDSSEQGFHKQPVKLGLSDGINVEVLDGVELDEEVIDNSMMGAAHG
ncbi:TPA: efflux RND transporter periplasmic adaptor subunit [Vibrio parahaemolyticus]|uniref:efflux RND transporter periplasmic adaptor subunit n=1 Tax=Vibrio parahaemolyticus TaxID=670 RepID=UPI000FEC3951|nr:efflux RND transporter periplasmic adaptor subunit [Vibrio parahaemolyticus]MCS0041593.1 efflux RND transporter periplasmic adaptor subunit [Vibrio parahaemolyticus]MCX8883825.1 efflux RND transporter periplasmic adaptor subunit [Vibrio parahaemolyticus]HAS3028353.1 efflux RND transporter periplasmic adaptor subunit [Vibrio parahaemolyticus]HAS3033630.1 efflux RND transporter periplasmic adaptor subunit [Vibrio parahaemolyticus]HAS3039213.1 efflux RND transporter periplasmic adaptor subunit